MNAATQPGLKKLLETTIFLHLVTEVNKHMGWYLMNECISAEAVAELELV